MHQQEVAGRIVLVVALAGCAAAPPPETRPIVVEPSGGSAPWSREARPPPRRPRGDDEPIPIRWRDDIASLDRGPAVIWIRADWEPTSMLLEREVWSDAAVTQAMRGWSAFLVDATVADESIEHALARFGVHRVPTVIVWRDGRPVARLEGRFDAGALLRELRWGR